MAHLQPEGTLLPQGERLTSVDRVGGSGMPTGGASSTGLVTGGVSSIGGSNSVGRLGLRLRWLASSPDAGGSSSINLGCTKTTLTNVNVYVIKDASPSAADTEGNMYVGGNLVPSLAGYSIGAKDVVDCTVYSLVGGGNVSNVVVKGGRAIVGGTITNATDQDCGGVARGYPPVDFRRSNPRLKRLVLDCPSWRPIAPWLTTLRGPWFSR